MSEAHSESDFPDSVRKRPGMYVGSTGQRGRQQLLREVASNSVDLALAGQVTTLAIAIASDGTITVTDDGPGIPVRAEADGTSYLTRVLTLPRDSPTADGHHPHVHLASGTGLHVVCALSDRVDVRTRRDAVSWRQLFSRGHATTPLERDDSTEPGTSVVFRPDPELFSDEPIDVLAVGELLRDLAALVPGLSTSLAVEEHRWTPGSAADLLAPDRSRHLVSASNGADRVELAVAVDPYADRPAHRRWYVNLRVVGEGDEALGRCVDDALAEALGGPLQGAVHIVVNALLLNPEFSGPTRSRCDDPRLLALVRNALLEGLPAIDARESWPRADESPGSL